MLSILWKNFICWLFDHPHPFRMVRVQSVYVAVMKDVLMIKSKQMNNQYDWIENWFSPEIDKFTLKFTLNMFYAVELNIARNWSMWDFEWSPQHRDYLFSSIRPVKMCWWRSPNVFKRKQQPRSIMYILLHNFKCVKLWVSSVFRMQNVHEK